MSDSQEQYCDHDLARVRVYDLTDVGVAETCAWCGEDPDIGLEQATEDGADPHADRITLCGDCRTIISSLEGVNDE
jgi:hypothetical protein